MSASGHDVADLLALYEAAPFGVAVIARDRQNLRLKYFNTLMGDHLGIDDDQRPDWYETPLSELWRGQSANELAKQLKKPKYPEHYTLPVPDESGQPARWLKLTIQARDWEDQPVYVVWADDISANKQQEQELKREVEAADAMAEMKANFLATMSHELRTPMQSVYGLLELIGHENPPARIAEMVGTARESASGMLEILDDILDLAKMDADKMELDMFEVPVRTLAYGILEALSVKVHNRDVALLDDIAEDVPPVIVGDPKRLRQIIMNLMGNALKFTEKGSVTLRITTNVHNIETGNDQIGLRFEIIDTGPGMPQSVADTLFQPFTQADSSTARNYGGTGLGLSISHKLVNLMDGHIGVTSEEGSGSTFFFEIPTESVSTDASTLELPDLSGISVLSVEDHPRGAREIANSLSSMGATVESVDSYAQALDLLKRRPYDVGIIDQGLPDGLGLDLIGEIMEIRPFMGIVMYTVRDDAGLQYSLQALGVPLLAKPASRLGLGQAVADAAANSAHKPVEGPQRLLIAEDTASVQDLLKRQLEAVGAQADFVDNGDAAYNAVLSGDYGILFTDLHMPGMDGYELVRKIRADEAQDNKHGHMPVIVLTADVQMAQRQTYLSYGFDECLLKPVSLGHFKRLLIRWGLLGPEQDDGEAGERVKSHTAAKAKDKQQERMEGPVDFGCVENQMGAMDANAVEMLGMFVEMSTELITRIRTAYENADAADLAEAAHSLKGSARSACCLRLGDIAAELQTRAENGELPGDMVEGIDREFKRASAAIAKLQQDYC